MRAFAGCRFCGKFIATGTLESLNAAASNTSSTFVLVAQTAVTWPQQELFMHFSGDRNPMHIDPVAARRTPPGAGVVYGMHMVLWALDQLVAGAHVDRSLGIVSVRFLKWMYLEDTVSLWFCAGVKSRFELRVGELVALSCFLQSGLAHDQPERPHRHSTVSQRREVPATLLLHEIEGKHGQAPIADLSASETLFPSLARTFGPRLAAEIATCSYVVGMEAPGLHSIDSVADWVIAPSLAAGRSVLSYEGIAVDPRFRRVRIRIAGGWIAGTLEAFVRHAPVRQATMEQVKQQVLSGEFLGMRALILGGSRGLGEIAAKCIAAGGGQSVLTYASGLQDAECVAAEIRDHGGSVSILRYDAREAPAPQLADVTGPFTHLLYFASGRMFRQKGELPCAECLVGHNAIYVQGFHDLCVELLRPESGRVEPGRKLVAFYPSSALLDDPATSATEFAASKAAGEQLCQEMERSLPRLQILVARLPRLLTDQTAPMFPERFPDAVAVLLPFFRQWNAT